MDRSLYKRLGDYIEKCEGRNSQDLYGEDDVLGVNNEGNIVKSKAKLHGVDLSPYKVVKNNNFVYNPARLDLGSISLYKGEGCVVSTLYVVFKVREDKEEELLTDYLDLWLKRKEFHRYVGYVNWGSAREYFWYDNITEVMIPVPPISEQRRIVSEYQTVERRIKNNEAMIKKLEETAQAIYHHTFVEGIDENNLPEGWRKGCLGEIANICSGKDHKDLHDGEIPIYGSGGLMRKGNDYLYEGESVLIPRKGTLNNIMYVNEAFWTVDTLFYTTMKIDNVALYLYYSIKDIDFLAQDSGTSVPSNTSKELNMTKLLIPTTDVLKEYDCQCQTIHCYIDSLTKETSHLRTLLSLLTSKLS